MIDDQDKLRMLIDPTSPYAVNGAYALGRAMDDLIITAALGTSMTGENGSTSTSFATATQQIAVGGTGLTIAKLRQARRILMANEVDVAMDPLYIAVTATQLDELLGTTEVTSSDYNTVKTLVSGDIDTFLGFKFIQCERLGTDGSGDRRCIAWAKSGMHLGMWNDITTKISERADKSYATRCTSRAPSARPAPKRRRSWKSSATFDKERTTWQQPTQTKSLASVRPPTRNPMGHPRRSSAPLPRIVPAGRTGLR